MFLRGKGREDFLGVAYVADFTKLEVVGTSGLAHDASVWVLEEVLLGLVKGIQEERRIGVSFLSDGLPPLFGDRSSFQNRAFLSFLK